MSANAEALITFADLVAAVQRSRGWYRRIARESGCRLVTLRRMANEPTYDPPVSEIEKIGGWYRAHGVPDHHPLAKREERAVGAE
jgi:hypothetical protein